MSQLPNEVASLLIPLGDGSLLVPNTNVAEIVPYLEPEPVEGKPDWVLGTINWRELDLPCISFEACSSGEPDKQYSKERLAIFNTVGAGGKNAFFALVIRGIPRLMRVVQQDLVEEDLECSQIEKVKVKLNGESAVIPDLLSLEKMVSGAFS